MNLNASQSMALLNAAAVSIFGAILSASFCGILQNRRNMRILLIGVAAIMAVQGILYFRAGPEWCYRIYPVVFHLPLIVLLWALSKKLLWSVICVLLAYLCCEIRRWIGLLVAALLHGDLFVQHTAELIITIPLLLGVLRFASPAIRQVMYYPWVTQCMFGSIPALYYAFDYVTRIYTNLLTDGNPAVSEFIPFICCLAYLAFVLHDHREEHRRQEMRQTQSILNMQLNQAVQEIDLLRASQEQIRRHRHDLRHHLQYLSSCIADGQDERALNYITEVTQDLEAQSVDHWCENEAVNLIVSAFAARGRRADIELEVTGALPASIPIADKDLCVLVSNALENAMHACEPLAAAGAKCRIGVQFRYISETERFFLQVINPCKEPVRFEHGLPISSQTNHGIGVKSICAIVDRYGGGSQFIVEEGNFILRLFL